MSNGSKPLTQRDKMKALWEQHPQNSRTRKMLESRCLAHVIIPMEPQCEVRTFNGPQLCKRHAAAVAALRKVPEYRKPKPLPVDPQVREANRKVIELQNETLRLKSEIQRLKQIKEPEAQPKPKPERPTAGHVYFLLSDNLVKIGWASDLDARLKAYSPGARLLAVMPGTRADEKRMHKKFGDLKTNRNEWFTYHPRVMEEVERIVREHGDPPRDLNEPMQTKRIVGPRLTNYIGGDRRVLAAGRTQVVRG